MSWKRIRITLIFKDRPSKIVEAGMSGKLIQPYLGAYMAVDLIRKLMREHGSNFSFKWTNV